MDNYEGDDVHDSDLEQQVNKQRGLTFIESSILVFLAIQCVGLLATFIIYLAGLAFAIFPFINLVWFLFRRPRTPTMFRL
ncbi:Oidioi.mRNA.OKI2018_I69.PAR.g12436.t1.cds [Oikopleura dioica]|uniref:Oidioi.mRNA.OKI2018_I69.PAR.g12436.t1.cds n=1 Tax=Oikopleura dioica TaxID=34765 RepID=A0ABN7RRH2_OIKDI|nr:Oidioi.mRNA.OKI2018_I69.PAR.g9454.t1.cds [Oikopleura dioica]CAG5090022.1 Oidioi.mRNA.OKI2018_I69.PAR.g12436.t1.cds [Oikopleura dioica]